MFRPIEAEQTGEASELSLEQIININAVNLSDSSCEFSSFAPLFLSSTEMSQEGLSEIENRDRNDPQQSMTTFS